MRKYADADTIKLRIQAYIRFAVEPSYCPAPPK